MNDPIRMKGFMRSLGQLDDFELIAGKFVELATPFEGVVAPSKVEDLGFLVAFCNHFRMPLAEMYWEGEGEVDMQVMAWLADVASVPTSILYSPSSGLRQALGPFVMRFGMMPRSKYDLFIRPRVVPDDESIEKVASHNRATKVVVDFRMLNAASNPS
jgi:hypothetical protein